MLSPSAIHRSDTFVGIEMPIFPPAPAATAGALEDEALADAESVAAAALDDDDAVLAATEAAEDVVVDATLSFLPQAVSDSATTTPTAMVLSSGLRNVASN
jgi:hypothetical protein